MTATDWVLLGVVAVSAVFGLMRGFVGVLASLAAWVLAGWAAFRFGAQLAVMLAGGAEPGPSQLLGGYAISFLVVLLVVGLVGWGVRKLVHGVGLSGIDRFLGWRWAWRAARSSPARWSCSWASRRCRRMRTGGTRRPCGCSCRAHC